MEVTVSERLKFPAPYFGGKSRVAALVWQRLGDCDNVIEPFCGSCAFLLARPHAPRVETINDADCHVANVWRALKHDPEAVAEWADAPVNEACMHAEHRWLVGVPAVPPGLDTPYLRAMYLAGMLGDAPLAFARDAALFRHRVRTDPDYFDARRAGRWLHGACCWIGGGWCTVPGESAAEVGCEQSRRPGMAMTGTDAGQGVHGAAKLPCEWEQLPAIYNEGRSVHAAAGRPQLADAYALGRGVHAGPGPSQKLPLLRANQAGFTGSGVTQERDLGTCAARRAWLLDWFSRLRDRLRCVRVCAGDFLRVCDSESVTTRLGTTGIFFDAPYRTRLASGEQNRAAGLYATDGDDARADDVVDRVIAYCLERGSHPKMRIAACGYAGEGYEVLLKHGWQEVRWSAAGGYANRNKANKNKLRELIFFSPNCVRGQAGLFDCLEENPENSSESDGAGVENGDETG